MRMKKNNRIDYSHVSYVAYKNLLRYFPVPTVEVVFFDKTMKKTLLFRRNNQPLKGVFFSMGGRILKNEQLLEAAVRKVKEEIGVIVNPKKLFFGGVQDEIHTKSIFPNIGYHCINIYFGYILNEERIVLDSQHSEARWFSVSNKKIHYFVKNKIRNLISAHDKTY